MRVVNVTCKKPFDTLSSPATRLKVLVTPLLAGNGSLQLKSMPQFVQLMSEAESEGEVYFLTMGVLAKCDQHAVRARFVEAGGLDKLLGFIQEGTKRRAPNLILWTLKVLEKLPPTDAVLKHQIAAAGECAKCFTRRALAHPLFPRSEEYELDGLGRFQGH